MSVWLLKAAEEGGQTTFPIVLKAFGEDATRLLSELLAVEVPLPSADSVGLCCAVSDASNWQEAESWLVQSTKPGALTCLVGSGPRLGAVADITCFTPLTREALRELIALLCAMQRLTDEPGVVCVEPDDLRFALRQAGRAWIAMGQGLGANAVEAATQEVLARLEGAGVVAGVPENAVIALLGDIAQHHKAVEKVGRAMQRWLGPEAMPVLGMRDGASDRSVRLLVLVTVQAELLSPSCAVSST